MQTASQGREKEKKSISGVVKSSAGLGRGFSGELQQQGKPGSSEWPGRGLREDLGDVWEGAWGVWVIQLWGYGQR